MKFNGRQPTTCFIRIWSFKNSTLHFFQNKIKLIFWYADSFSLYVDCKYEIRSLCIKSLWNIEALKNSIITKCFLIVFTLLLICLFSIMSAFVHISLKYPASKYIFDETKKLHYNWNVRQKGFYNSNLCISLISIVYHQHMIHAS